MTSTIIDDASLTYTGSGWTHANDGSSNLHDGTQSYSNSADAGFNFSFSGTGFDMCAGQKADRGAFTYTIDGASQGSGTELGTGMQQDPTCTVVASVRNLSPGTHQIVFNNAGTTWFAVDSVTTYSGSAASVASLSSTSSALTTSSTTAASSSSTIKSASSQQVSSVSLPTASMSSGMASSAIASSSSVAQHASQASSGKKAAIIAAPILAGAILASLIFFLVMRCRRSREDRAIGPSESTHYLDEKTDSPSNYGLDMYEKRSLTDRIQTPIQQLAGRISPIPFGKPRGHNRLNSEMSLESNTEPYRPSSLVQPPPVDPFYLPDEMPRQSIAPPPAALARRPSQFTYRNRLMAAASALPEWRSSDTSYYAPTERQSTVHSLMQQPPIEEDPMAQHADIFAGMMSYESKPRPIGKM